MLVPLLPDGADMHRLKAAKYRADTDPRELAIYTPADAARYLGIKSTTLGTWIYGRNYETNRGMVFFEPLIKPADPANRLLSFFNLAEAHVLAASRYEHLVSMKAIRSAIETLRNKYPSEHPLISKDFFTNGRDVFIKTVEETENLSTPGQLNFKPILDLFLAHIGRDKNKVADRVYPVIKGLPHDKVISIVHGVSSSRPAIDGTGVPVWVVYDRFMAGEKKASIARDFGISLEKIQRAIAYVEKRAA